jgi:protein disulfide isomerase
MLYTYADMRGGDKLAEYLGANPKEMPQVFSLASGADNKKLKYKFETSPADMTAEGLTKFLDDVIAGSLTPFLKSQAPIENKGSMVEVVGTNFEELVLDESKDVLIMYYAPWCGHCKKLKPTWDDLAEEYKDNADLVIAKFDQTMNEAAKGWPIKSFPTLIFYGKDNKEGLLYEGPRELEAFKSYLQDKSTVLKAGSEAAKEDL